MKLPRNHYENLKVDQTATIAEIRKAYRRLASIHHPDRNPGDASSVIAMQCINVAYEALCNPKRRAAHDLWIDQAQASKAKKPDFSSSEKSFQEADPGFQNHSNSSQEGRGQGDHHWGFGGFDDIFGNARGDPTLKDDHRPKDLDKAHLSEFTIYNDAIRRRLIGVTLEYLTPDLIYRAFVIDKRRGIRPPKTIEMAYKAITRALKGDQPGLMGLIKGLYLNRTGLVQGIIAGFAGFAVLSLAFIPFIKF